MEDKNIYDYDPYVLFDDWSSAVFDKLQYNIHDAEEEDLVNINGERLMVVDGIAQNCSMFMFFTELLSRLGVYDNNGYKTISEEDAKVLVRSSMAMEEVLAMFKEYNIKGIED